MVAVPVPTPALFRAMCADDLDAVIAIERANYPFPWTLGIFRDCLHVGHECWVLEQRDEVIGYGVLSAAAGEAHILNVSVVPAQQRQGHGRRMVLRLLDLARWHRVMRVFLEVRPSNTHACVLYESLGFNEIGRRPAYYPDVRGREDAIVMAMELLPPEQ